MNNSSRIKVLWAIAFLTILTLAAGIMLLVSASNDKRALKAGKIAELDANDDIETLARYSTAEQMFFALAESPMATPRLPMTVGKPDDERHERLESTCGWIPERKIYSWKSLAPRRAAEAISALHSIRDGWRISMLDFAAIAGKGDEVALTVAIETVRPDAREE